MIKLIELFGGIGTQTMAFENIPKFQGNFKCVDLVEWDDKSVDIYNKVHHTDFKGGKLHGDVNNVRGYDIGSKARNSKEAAAIEAASKDGELNMTEYTPCEDFDADKIVHNGKDIWVMTCSSPCQSLSNAGLKDGMAPGVNEKSSFLWEGIRILRECYELDPVRHTRQPHYFIIENVTPIHNKNNVNWFDTVLDEIASMGYTNYVMDVNGLDINEPQMRDRTFVVSVLRGVGLKRYIPFKDMEYHPDSESRLDKLINLFNSTSWNDIKEEDDASTKAHKIIIYDANKKEGFLPTSKYSSTNSERLSQLRAAEKELKKLMKELDKYIGDKSSGQGELDFDMGDPIEELKAKIDDQYALIEELKKDDVKEYNKETHSLQDYPFLAKEGLIEEPIKEFAIIDISFQSKNGQTNLEHCKVYKDKFPTLLCNTDHVFILDPIHNCLRRILAKEAWLLQTYSDEAFANAKAISAEYMKKKSLSSLYQSLHKTAGDAILVKAFEKIIEPLEFEANPRDKADDAVLAASWKNEGSIEDSRDRTWKSALDNYNTNYAPEGGEFVPKQWVDKYTAPARAVNRKPTANIYTPKDIKNDLFKGVEDNALEESKAK